MSSKAAAWHNASLEMPCIPINVTLTCAFILGHLNMRKASLITEGMWDGQEQVCHWDVGQPFPITDV